ncbi:MAG: translesion DNA synthesis-associated protein ImuA [Sinimarinibacterium sp.]|jgi:protein ImuA
MNRAAIPQSMLRDPRLWRGSGAAPLRAESTGHAALDAVLPGGGWPLGAVSEILHPCPGVGELSLVLPLLVRLTGEERHVAFIAPPCRPHAPAWAAAGVRLHRLLIVEAIPETDRLWATEQLLHAGAAAALLWCETVETTALRRLQLAAERGGSVALLLRPLAAEREHSVAALRLRVTRRAGVAEVDVLKCRGARPPGRYAVGQ